MAVQDYKINYKSDFVLNINGDAGWATQFCIKFWTGMPSQAYFVGFDGVKYVNCRVGDTPTQLMVMFDDHHLPIGKLKMQIAYHTTIEEFPGSVFDEVTNARDVIVTIDGTDYQVLLDFTGEDAPELEFNLPAYANEAERIQNELQRQQNEADRIAAELQREQSTAAAVQGAENVNAQLNGTTLTVTNRHGVSTSVNTKGEQGAQGPVGPEGPQGEQGETGISIVSFTPKSETSTTLIYTVTFSDGHTQDVPIPKGAKGDTGATGPQGQKGDTGVSITAFTYTSETETDMIYTVTFSDSTTQQVSIPKGAKGDTGQQGPVGPQGPQGPMGDVAVITPEQQAAFTMYSTTGQNTNGPMTQKAVTDVLVAGSISYDNSQSGLVADNVQGALDEVSDELYTESSYPFELGTIEATTGREIEKTDGTRIRTKGNVPKSTNKINFTVTRSCERVNIILYNNGDFAGSVQSAMVNFTAGTYVYDVDIENSWDSYRIVCFTSGYTSQNLDGNYSVGYSSFKDNVLRNYPIIQDNFESDFDIADTRNYVIARFENGHLRTKNFNSATTPNIASIDGQDLSISDGNGYAIALFKDGHLKTKNFNSKDLINYVQYSELKGKRVVFVGDSFTQGNELPDSSKVYCNVFAEVSGCTIVNLGVAGSSIAKRANNAARFYTRCTASNLAGADLIIVQGGTNDFDLDSKAIGDLFDYVYTTPVDYFGGKTIVAPSDTEAFGGAMHQLIQTIRTNAPRVPIVFVTPTNRGTYGHSRLPTSYEYNKNMNTMQEFRDAMERICEFYQIPVFKAHLIPQLDFANDDISLAYSVGDNLHPNAAGNDVLGKALYKFIMNNITLN